MTTARAIITAALSFHLNRLSPGEAIDADLAAVALNALNHVADEVNGQKSALFREFLSPGTVTGVGTLGTTWAALSPGDEILGASVAYSPGTNDVPLGSLTMAQYQGIIDKTTIGLPQLYAHDGAATVYFWPVPSGQVVSLRTRQVVSDFADLETDYVMPRGYKAAFSALLAEKIAPPLLNNVPPAVTLAAMNARSHIHAQSINPAIINSRVPRGNILSGWW